MNKSRLIKSVVGLIVIGLITSGVAFWQGWVGGQEKPLEAAAEVKSATDIAVPIETIGEVFAEQSDQVGSSWPGEIISSGDIEVQPAREGTLVEWKVKIGQKVKQGQVLARLSAPPATPELTQTLAEQAQNLARSRAQAAATASFTQKNIEQLSVLRDALQKNLASTGSTLNGSGSVEKATALSAARAALEQAQGEVKVKEQNARKIIEQILNRQVLKFTNTYDPQYFRYGSVRRGLGELDSNSRNRYEELVYKLVAELKNSDNLPIETAQIYLQTAIKMINGSIIVDGFEQADLDGLRDMVNDDQTEFLTVLKEFQEAKSEVTAKDAEFKSKEVEYQTKDTDYKLSQLGQEKDYAEKKKEIDQKIAELEKDLELAKAEVKGAEAAYGTIAAALNGGLNISAPRSGVVSTILKKNGDFVTPGTPVASINSGNNKDLIVRFRIPGNLIPPQAGETLTVIRPGFPKDGKQIKLVGIGLSLDGNGSFLADADFIESVDWPVHASVRVLPAASQSQQSLISLSAVWWDDAGKSNVWLVTEEGNIRPQEVKTGRTLGDKIEVVEGLNQGTRVISKATPDLKTGMKLNQISTGPGQNANEEPEGDGHGHSHDE